MSEGNGTALRADADASPALFSYEVRREGRPLVVLNGVLQGNGPALVVEATVTRASDGEAVVRPFPFATQQQARRFVDQVLLTFEYLDCTVVEPGDRVLREPSAADT